MKLAVGLEHTFSGLCSQRPDELVLEIDHAREEAEGLKGLVGGDRNGRVSEFADLDVMQAKIATDEVRKRAHCGCIAVAFDEHQGTDRYSGCHACVGGECDAEQTKLSGERKRARCNEGLCLVQVCQTDWRMLKGASDWFRGHWPFDSATERRETAAESLPRRGA